MRIPEHLLRQIEYDLALDTAFTKGRDITVSNCWHFYTDGNDMDSLFYDKQDFVDGMNRIYLVSRKFGNVVILAFALMDTHLHFVAYGNRDDCNRFFHEYLRRASLAISGRHGDCKKLLGVRVGFQKIDTDTYLKKAICYVIKNPTSAGLRYLPYDYPWSSGSLYFRNRGLWTSPAWSDEGMFSDRLGHMRVRERRSYLKSRDVGAIDAAVSEGMVFPGEYVAVEIVERIFRTCRSYSFFMGKSREEDLDTLPAAAQGLALPIHELRQHRDELGRELFGESGIRNLDMARRLKLARALRAKYMCSARQVCKSCGLVYDEVKDKV